MTTATQPQVFEEIAEFLAAFPSREQVLAFRPSPETQERARKLLEKSNTGELTDEEREELEDFGRAELFVRMLKARL
ncbi:MAG: hypothetical protein AABP62_26545 [Planctomycetota bacterium]